VTVTVTISGGASFRTPRNRPLLEALEDRGAQPEAACRSGERSLCRVRVVSGETFNAQQARLRMSDAQFGYVHSLRRRPVDRRRDCVLGTESIHVRKLV
jgi:ferredoxin